MITTYSIGALLNLKAIAAEEARRRFRDFIPLAWPTAEPSRAFIPNWHIAMPALYAAGSNVAALYLAVFCRLLVLWHATLGKRCSRFGLLGDAQRRHQLRLTIHRVGWGVAGIIGPRIGGVLYDKYHDYKAAFYTAAALAAVALLCELTAQRPARGS